MTGEGFTNQAFSGSASFRYDDASFNNTSFELFNSLPVLSVTSDPSSVGGVSIDTTTLKGYVARDDGAFLVVGVGMDFDGETKQVSAAFPELNVSRHSAPPGDIVVSDGTVSNGFGLPPAAMVTVTETIVPEPSVLGLTALAALTLMNASMRYRRRHRSGFQN